MVSRPSIPVPRGQRSGALVCLASSCGPGTASPQLPGTLGHRDGQCWSQRPWKVGCGLESHSQQRGQKSRQHLTRRQGEPAWGATSQGPLAPLTEAGGDGRRSSRDPWANCTEHRPAASAHHGLGDSLRAQAAEPHTLQHGPTATATLAKLSSRSEPQGFNGPGSQEAALAGGCTPTPNPHHRLGSPPSTALSHPPETPRLGPKSLTLQKPKHPAFTATQGASAWGLGEGSGSKSQAPGPAQVQGCSAARGQVTTKTLGIQSYRGGLLGHPGPLGTEAAPWAVEKLSRKGRHGPTCSGLLSTHPPTQVQGQRLPGPPHPLQV